MSLVSPLGVAYWPAVPELVADAVDEGVEVPLVVEGPPVEEEVPPVEEVPLVLDEELSVEIGVELTFTIVE